MPAMIEVTYRLEPEHLHLYRKLATDRTAGRGGGAEDTWGLYLLCTLAVAAFLASADLVYPGLTGQPFAFAEFFTGLLAGIAVFLALMWPRYSRLSRAAVRPDGPTLAQHRLSVTPDGLRATSRFVDGQYKWFAFEDVTIADGVIVLWIEPGAGVLVPRSAFASPAAETAFLEAVRGFMAAATAASPKR
jgi:hypothetical protein